MYGKFENPARMLVKPPAKQGSQLLQHWRAVLGNAGLRQSSSAAKELVAQANNKDLKTVTTAKKPKRLKKVKKKRNLTLCHESEIIHKSDSLPPKRTI